MDSENNFSIPGNFNKPKETSLTNLLEQIGNENLSFNVEKLCQDSDFSESFTQAITDREEQKKYLIHTSKYNNEQQDYDPKYVLFFRRTLPAEEPKPEERWTHDYMQVLNGLRREIPEGPHRWHSIIICDSLEHISINGEKQGDTRAFTDGELVVNFTEYNQKGCICTFKPQREKDALKNYLETEGALDLRETTKRVREIKTK